ncbi:MAG: ATP-binding protein [Desulfomonilia bacterium]|jgi:PAS domain S-box-containing protein
MAKKDSIKKCSANLRKQAEKRLQKQSTDQSDISPEQARRLLHELQVHQIELEMQNEELHRAQEELEISRTKYFDLYDFAPVGYLTIDKEGSIKEANLTATQLLGVGRSFVVKQQITSFIYRDDKDIHYLHLKKLFDTGLPQEYELRFVKKDGSQFWAFLKANAVQEDESGSIVCQTALIDITERKKAEEERIKLLAELERSNKDLEQFADVASHDLQEPLRMVSSFTQLLARRYGDKLDQNARDYIEFAVKGSNRMQRMIQDLLNYSRVISVGRAPVPIDMNSVIDETLANLHLAISDSGASVIHDFLPVVMADHSQFVQVFQNLIGNAIKFRRDDPLRIHVSAGKIGDEWVFSVKDNGMGIEPQYFERIFVLFERLHAGETYQGAGIGLALCKRIIARLGGRIWVESNPGKGSTFYFTLKGVEYGQP